jgi:hypothetical protein
MWTKILSKPCICLRRLKGFLDVLPSSWTVSSGMLRRVAVVRTDDSEEFSASFIRVTRIFIRRMPSFEMLRPLALVRRDVSDGRKTSFIRLTRIGVVGTTLTVTSNRSCEEILWWWRTYVPPKRQILQEPHGVTGQKTAFFIVRAVNTSKLSYR